MEANPTIDPRAPDVGTRLVIPSQFVLPRGPRKGIVINLAEMRLYYFHKDGKLVTTHPIGIGRPDWETPLGSGKVIEKTKDPYWHPPASIRAWYDEHAAIDLLTKNEAQYSADSALAGLEEAYARGETDEFVKPTLIIPAPIHG